MSQVKVAVAGAAGRMGRTLVATVAQSKDLMLVSGLERHDSEFVGQDTGLLAGIGENAVKIAVDPEKALAAADVLIDFTTPETSISLAEAAAKSQCAIVVGTTGFDDKQNGKMEAAAQHVAMVKSGNMSLGVNLLHVLAKQAAKALDGSQFDIEIVEMHHRRKVDAPSGTALLLGEAVASGRGVDLAKKSVRVRDGITGPRAAGDIGFATLRGGTVIGEHTVIFAGNGERIELGHVAQDRSLFASGAVQAVRWVYGKTAGLYSMQDVLNLS